MQACTELKDEILFWLEKEISKLVDRDWKKWGVRLSASFSRTDQRDIFHRSNIDGINNRVASQKRMRDKAIEGHDLAIAALQNPSEVYNLASWTSRRQKWIDYNPVVPELDDDWASIEGDPKWQHPLSGSKVIDLHVFASITSYWAILPFPRFGRDDVKERIAAWHEKTASTGKVVDPWAYPLAIDPPEANSDGCGEDWVDLSFLVRPTITSLSDVLRDLQTHKAMLIAQKEKEAKKQDPKDPYPLNKQIFYLVSGDDRFATKIKEQGFYFLKYEPGPA